MKKGELKIQKVLAKKSLVISAAVCVLLVALMAGCLSQAPEISEGDAKGVAEQFVIEHVKFFSKNGSSTIDVPEYQFQNVLVKDEKGFFAITVHVTAALGNDTKENDIVLKIDKKSGKVVEFGGKKLLE